MRSAKKSIATILLQKFASPLIFALVIHMSTFALAIPPMRALDRASSRYPLVYSRASLLDHENASVFQPLAASFESPPHLNNLPRNFVF